METMQTPTAMRITGSFWNGAEPSELPENHCQDCKGLGYLRCDEPQGSRNFGKLMPCPCRRATHMQWQIDHHEPRYTNGNGRPEWAKRADIDG